MIRMVKQAVMKMCCRCCCNLVSPPHPYTCILLLLLLQLLRDLSSQLRSEITGYCETPAKFVSTTKQQRGSIKACNLSARRMRESQSRAENHKSDHEQFSFHYIAACLLTHDNTWVHDQMRKRGYMCVYERSYDHQIIQHNHTISIICMPLTWHFFYTLLLLQYTCHNNIQN